MSAAEGYCEVCEALVPLDDVCEKTTNTGKRYLEGKCRACGALVQCVPGEGEDHEALSQGLMMKSS